MKTGEIEKSFNFTRSTISSWKKDKGSGRNLLYHVLEALPMEFVENIQKNLEANKKQEEERENLLK